MFLRFVTGTSVCLANEIKITFSAGCYPVSHTCDNTLELPTKYNTFSFKEFESDFQHILNIDEYSCLLYELLNFSS